MFRFQVRHGNIFDRVRQIISFKRSNWLEKIVNFITQERTEATDDFEMVFYKLFNNASYGQTMENVRN